MIAPMTRHPVFFSAPLFLAVLCSAVSSASAHTPLVAPKLMQRALSEGSVRVIVELGGMTAVPEGFLRDDVAVAILRGDIATAQNSGQSNPPRYDPQHSASLRDRSAVGRRGVD
jgi:hypothetical protein